MKYKKFKNAGIEVPVLAAGTWAIGGANYGAVDRTDSIKAIRSMVDKGANLIDTAPVYGNGASEKIVGEAISTLSRDKLLISTKFGLRPNPGGYARDATYKNCIREAESSLINLGTDYLDFYYVHWPDVNTPISETMSALNVLKKQGKIRFIGVSNFTKEQILEAEEYGQVDVQQPPFSMVDQRYVELIEWGYGKGIDSMIYAPLGAGILTGAIRSMPDFAPGDMRLNFYTFFKEPTFSKIMELLKTLDAISAGNGKPLAQIALNWSVQKNFVGSALVGVRDEKEAQENCAAFDWDLSAAEMKRIDDEIARLEIV